MPRVNPPPTPARRLPRPPAALVTVAAMALEGAVVGVEGDQTGAASASLPKLAGSIEAPVEAERFAGAREEEEDEDDGKEAVGERKGGAAAGGACSSDTRPSKSPASSFSSSAFTTL